APAAVRRRGGGPEDPERELRQPLVVLRPDELRRRPFRAGDAGLLQRRQRAAVRVLERLQLAPLARDAVAEDRVCDVALFRERDQLANRHVERRREREAERATL